MDSIEGAAESAAIKAWHVSLLDSFRRISRKLRYEGGRRRVERHVGREVQDARNIDNLFLVSSASFCSAGTRRLPRGTGRAVVEYKFKD